MDLLSWVGLALIIIAFAIIIASAVKKNPRLGQVGAAVNALGCALVAVTDGIDGNWVSMALFTLLALANLYSFNLSRRAANQEASA